MSDKKRSGGQKRRPNTDTATVRDLHADLPSAIKVDHRSNSSRAAIYDSPPELAPYIGPKSCYRVEELEAFLNDPVEGLFAVGLGQPVKCYLTKTGDAHLSVGFRRHAALLLAEVRGELHRVPGLGGKITYTTVAEPKTPADWARLDDLNRAENDQRKTRTPIDILYNVKYRLSLADDKGQTPTREQVADSLGISKRQLDRYMELDDLPPWQKIEVHEGRLSISAALAKKSEEGRGNSKGKRPGIPHSAMQRAIAFMDERPMPAVTLGPDDVCLLFKRLVGEVEAKDLTDAVLDLVAWLDCPKPERKKPDTDATSEPKSAGKPRRKPPTNNPHRKETA